MYFPSGAEAPEFPRQVLDSLRQPLESGQITIHRSRSSASFPAKTQLVLAANPCPCGNAGAADLQCQCSPSSQRRYLARLSGPLLDRIDLQLRVEKVGLAAVRMQADGVVGSMSTVQASGLVREARGRSSQRLRGMGFQRNADIPASALRHIDLRPAPGATDLLDRALAHGQVSMRGYSRIQRVAWSLADLEGNDRPQASHVAEALYYRVSDAQKGVQ